MALKDRPVGGFHRVLDSQFPYLFVDTTMQAWPDAEYSLAHRHGVAAFCVTAWRPKAGLDEAVEDAMEWHRLAREHEGLVLATKVEDIRHAKANAQAAIVIAAQGGDFLGTKLHRVEAFQKLGLRMMLLTYNASNHLAGGLLEEQDAGLTRLGRLVVAECNRVGIVLDGTHTGKRSVLEMIDLSEKPCVFSHSNPSRIVPNPRNIDDEQIRACAKRGGVIGLAPWGPLVLKPETHQWPTVDDFIDHIDHVLQVTGGSDHVAIGTDMSLGTYPHREPDPWGDPGYPSASSLYDEHVTADTRSPQRNLDGFNDYSEITHLVARLEARNYGSEAIAGILGENILRVFSEVWR